MDEYLKQFMSSGKNLIQDTKTPRKVNAKPKKESLTAPEGSPHDIFVKRIIQDKPKKSDLVKEFGRFITLAEQDL